MMERVAGGQCALLPWTRAMVTVSEGHHDQIPQYPAEAFYAMGGEKLFEGMVLGYLGFAGREEGEALPSKGKVVCFRDTSCTCAPVSESELIFSS